MSAQSEERAFDLDGALARLAAEAGPSRALEARVLADAALVSAGRRPAPAKPNRAERAGLGQRLAGLVRRPAYGFAGAAATLALSLAIGLGFWTGEEAPRQAGFDDAVLSQLSPLDSLERDVIATLDEDLLDPDAPF